MIYTKLRPYQMRGLQAISKFDGVALLADEMGLGKSLQSLAWWSLYKGIASPVVIVCPASLKYNWEREVHTHLRKRCIVLDGLKPPTWKPLDNCRIIIVNYDILHAWLPWLKKHKPKTLIFDEAHYVKNRTAKRSKALKQLARKCQYKIALSGTPMTARPVELWNILNILKPSLWPSFFSYADSYCNPKRTRYGWDFRGAANLSELHSILKKECMIRRLKKNVLKELPDKEWTTVVLPLANRKEYRAAEQNFAAWMETHHKGRKGKKLHAKHLVKMAYLRKLVGQGKIKAVIEWVQNYLQDTDTKLILFAHHKDTVEQLYKAFPHQSVMVYGGTPIKDRLRHADRFNKDPQVRVFIGNLQAAGTGLNLTKATDVGFVEYAWSPGDHTQATDRAHRIGQDKTVMCWYFTTKETIEESMCKLLLKKQQVLNEALDGKKVQEETQVFDYLLQSILERNEI